jgi:NlpC/P60 family
MEKSLGDTIRVEDVKRGDLVFWKGHMGVMLDGTRLLHANAFHMAVAIEPLAEAVARIEKSAGPVTAVRRL